MRPMWDKPVDNCKPESASIAIILDATLVFGPSLLITCFSDHAFNWSDVQILDYEPYLNKRLISEMLFI